MGGKDYRVMTFNTGLLFGLLNIFGVGNLSEIEIFVTAFEIVNLIRSCFDII
jgi:hypothetical protein